MILCRQVRVILTDSKVLIKKGFVRCTTIDRLYSSENVLKSPYFDIPLPDIPLHRYVWQNIDKWPQHTAIECGVTGRKYTYNDLYVKSRRFAGSLRKFGLKRGETFGIILPNTPDFPIAYLGALESGLIPTTFNPNYSTDEIVHQLNDCKSNWVVCHPINLQAVLEAKKQIKTTLNIICTHNLDGSSPKCDDNVILFEDTLNMTTEWSGLDDAHIDCSDTTLIAYSSGTTGLPKGTCLTHNSLTANLRQMGHPMIDKFVDTTGEHQDVIPAVLPFFHLYGNAIILLQALSKGAKIITLPRFEPKSFLRILENNSNMLLYVVPPIIFLLGNHEDVEEKHLRGIREMMSAAAPCSQDDVMRIKHKTNNHVLFSQGYGLTETSPVLTIYAHDGSSSDNFATVGKIVSNTFGKIVDTENGNDLPTKSTGELCFKGPQLMKCYLNNPKATADMIDSDGWLHTGDVGYYDHEGFFYITDRLKELIKVKGFQVAPAELEYVIRKHPAVLEAGVVGVPSDKTGETPVAFVKTIPGAKITEEDIKIFLASKLSKHKHLSSVKFLQDIPKTPSGKILRKELKKLALS